MGTSTPLSLTSSSHMTMSDTMNHDDASERHDKHDQLIKSSELINFASTISPIARSSTLSKPTLPSPQSLKRPLSSPVIASPEQAYQHVITSPYHPKPRVIHPNMNQADHSDERFDLLSFHADYNLTMLKVDLLTQPFTSSRMQSAVNHSINQSIIPTIRPLHTPQPGILMRTRSSNHISMDANHSIHDMPRASQSTGHTINPSTNHGRRSMSVITQPRQHVNAPQSARQPINQPTSHSDHQSRHSSPVHNQTMKHSINHVNPMTIAQLAQDYEESPDGITCRMPRFVYEERLRTLLQAMETVDVRSPAAVKSVILRSTNQSNSKPTGQPIIHQPIPRKTRSPDEDSVTTSSPSSESSGSLMLETNSGSSSSGRSQTDNLLNAKRVKLLAMAAASH